MPFPKVAQPPLKHEGSQIVSFDYTTIENLKKRDQILLTNELEINDQVLKENDFDKS